MERPPQREPINEERRNFLRMGIAGAAFVAGPIVWEEGWNSFGAETLKQNITELESVLAERYGIPMRGVSSRGGKQTFGTYTYEEIQHRSLYLTYKALESLRNSLAFYPPEVIREHLRGIQIGYDIVASDASALVTRADGLALPFEGKMLIGTTDGPFAIHEALVGQALDSSTVHHELAHIFSRNVSETEWKMLHPGVRYAGKDWDSMPKQRGFARNYGMVNYREDIATVAEKLFRPGLSELQTRARSLFNINNEERDIVVNNKKEFLKKMYEQLSYGRMGPAYWNAVNSGTVSEKFWDQGSDSSDSSDSDTEPLSENRH